VTLLTYKLRESVPSLAEKNHKKQYAVELMPMRNKLHNKKAESSKIEDNSAELGYAFIFASHTEYCTPETK